MSEKRMFSVVNKTLLKNVIRHTDAHNKVVEEGEMWRQYRKQKDSPAQLRERENSFLKDRGADMRYEFSSRRERRAHMDDEPSSTHWMRTLYKAEEEDKDRWGHSGFKELYPEKFKPSGSSSSDESDRKYHSSKKEKSIRKREKRKREWSDSDISDSDLDTSDDKHSKKRKKKHKHKDKSKKKKKKHKKRRYREGSETS